MYSTYVAMYILGCISIQSDPTEDTKLATKEVYMAMNDYTYHTNHTLKVNASQ